MRSTWHGIPIWSLVVPVLAIGVLATVWENDLGWTLVGFVAAVLITAAFAVVHHAEVIALRVGVPAICAAAFWWQFSRS